MRRLLAITITAVVLLSVASGAAWAAPGREELHSAAQQAPVSVSLDDAGWSDPSVGTWDSAARLATLTKDLYGSIQVLADNLTLEGNSHTLTGDSTGIGVSLSGRRNVLVRNVAVTSFNQGFYLYNSSPITLTANTASGNQQHGIYITGRASSPTGEVLGNALLNNTANGNDYGIFLNGCSNSTLTGNSVSSNRFEGIHVQSASGLRVTDNTADGNTYDGIFLKNSPNNAVTGNVASGNQQYGLRLEGCTNNVLTGNSMAQNRYNFRLEGTFDLQYGHTIDTSNLVDGKPIVYRQNSSDATIDSSSNAGMVILANCVRMTVRDLTLTNNDAGVLFWNTDESRVENVQARYNATGIRVRSSTTNTLTSNVAASNGLHGIWLDASSGNTLDNNTANLNSSYGIFLQSANGNTLTKNTVSDNAYGLYYNGASSNKYHGNKMISNGVQAYVTGGSGNAFNEPRPTGGNYWDNWTTPDTDLDGFVDNGYQFSGGRDDLPLATQSGSTDTIPPTTSASLSGTPGNNGWYRSDVLVTLTATDNPGGSGVAVTQYSFDGTNWNTYTGPFAVASEGAETIYYRSIDKAGNVEQAGSETPLFSEDFSGFDSSRWVGAGFLPSYVGQPQTLYPTTVDGRSALYMQESVANVHAGDRWGIATANSIAATPYMAVEVAFKPVGDLDGLAELWLYSETTGRSLRVTAFAGDFGGNRSVIAELSTSPPTVRSSPNPSFSLNEWLIFRVEGTPNDTKVSLLDANRNARWTTGFGVGLASFLGNFKVALSQQIGAPSLINLSLKAYFDSVKVVQVDYQTGSVGINIDKTPPTIAAERSPEPNAKGWNNTDVTVRFTASDAVSGLDTVTADQIISSEGANQSVTGVATDLAGNSASVTVGDISIDKTPPEVKGVPTTSPTVHGWYNGDVTVQWVVSDNLSGVDPADVPPDSVIAGEGAGFSAGPVTLADRAGNTASASLSDINIDKTAPTLALGEASPAANQYGWNNTNVAIPFSAADDLSGLDPSSPVSRIVLSDEGFEVSATVTVADLAGNTASQTTPTFRIDKTAPSISASAFTTSGEEYAAGTWTQEDVTVRFACSDGLSGLATAPADTTVNVECKDGAVTGVCTDFAGNSASVTFAGIDIDRTPPTMSAIRNPEPNADGWNNTDVAITFVVEDGLSGLASVPAPVTVAQEGAGMAVVGTAVDLAGNSITLTVDNINIDKTPPTIAAYRTAPNAYGWNNTNVVVSFEAQDQDWLSGLASVTAPVAVSSEGAGQTVTGVATDRAENSTTAVVSDINVDKTPPTLSGAPTTSPTAAGWYNTDVTVAWSVSDALSGVDPATLPADVVVTGEGAGLGAGPVTASDYAGNSAVASVSGINVDRTLPIIDIVVPQPDSQIAAGTALQFSAADALSGVASLVGRLDDGETVIDVTSGYAPTPGNYVLTVEATDAAGNTAVEARYFTVYMPRTASVAGNGSYPSSPEYYAKKKLADKAVFSFTCKYESGQSVPSSRWNTQLMFDSSWFRSTNYDWLMVDGAWAQFQGSGVFNGIEGYGFRVTVIDGSRAADRIDRIRIQIWDTAYNNATIYDTQPGDDDLAMPTTGLLQGQIKIKD